MSASMAEVLAEHQPTTSSSSFNQPNGGGAGRYCSCGEKFEVLFTELADDENDTTPRLNAKLAAHQADSLAAAGYGKLEDAWDEAYKFGVEDERTSEANIGIAGDLCNQTPCQCKVQPARVNPHRRPE